MWYSPVMESYFAIERNEVLIYATGINLETLCPVKEAYCMIPLM